VFLVISLVANGGKTCRSPIHLYLVFLTAMHGVQAVQIVAVRLELSLFLARHRAMEPSPFSLRICTVIELVLGSWGRTVMHLVWVLWIIVGIYLWCLEKYGSNKTQGIDCWKEAPLLFGGIVVIVTSNICFVTFLLIIGILYFLVCVPIIRHYFPFPTSKSIMGASQSLIETTTSTKQYVGLEDGIGVGDAVCVICLLDYTPKDCLRILSCRHHFHRECIDQWLVRNKTCVTCRRPIDT